jgi:hypothetical protein
MRPWPNQLRSWWQQVIAVIGITIVALTVVNNLLAPVVAMPGGANALLGDLR